MFFGEWKNIEISRQTINNVLKNHKRNGSPYKGGKKNWNYFRAKSPNDIWQMDVKGPFRIEGKKQYGKPKKILMDNDKRFARKFEKWCMKEDIEVEHTPPYYPQTKGKIERAIRTFNEEFLKLKKVFENILPTHIFQKMLPMSLDITAT